MPEKNRLLTPYPCTDCPLNFKNPHGEDCCNRTSHCMSYEQWYAQVQQDAATLKAVGEWANKKTYTCPDKNSSTQFEPFICLTVSEVQALLAGKRPTEKE